MRASGTVRMRVYWLILLRPYSPSLESSSSRGTIGTSSCMTIDDVMYGYTPIATIEKVCNDPPERMFSICSKLFWFNADCSAPVFTPGTGTWAAMRNTTRSPSVNRILRRRSGTLNALRAAFTTSLLLRLGRRLSHGQGDRSPGGFDLLASGPGQRDIHDVDGRGDRPVAQDLDRLRRRIHEAGILQRLRRDGCSRLQTRQILELNDLITRLELIVEATFGHALIT